MTDIFVIDDQHPEDLAMLQALYSRSPASVVTHLDKLQKSGSGKFMENYYVGYGHASIGDCGATTVFIEQVSMLVAKAVQDNPLYNGQEASTRYLDFSKQTVVDPYHNPASAAIQTRWMEIYNRVLPLLIEALKQRYPFSSADYKSEKIWANALNARAFDIARALLPIGTTTLLSWSTTLRSARDNLRRMKHHPLPEVRGTAKKAFAALLGKIFPQLQGRRAGRDEQSPVTPMPRSSRSAIISSASMMLNANSRPCPMNGMQSAPVKSSRAARPSICKACVSMKKKHCRCGLNIRICRGVWNPMGVTIYCSCSISARSAICSVTVTASAKFR